MSDPTLFVCKSCHRSSEDLPESAKSDGTCLLEQLQAAELPQTAQVKLQSVDCLWLCDHGSVAALSSTDKPTYVFSNLPVEGSAEALQQFAALYATSKKGNVPWKKLPAVLQSTTIAKVPPPSGSGNPTSYP
jgi:predicted metal-binding protein